MAVNDGRAMSGVGEIRRKLSELNRFEPNSSAFISCYLDMRAGQSATTDYLNAQASTWRRELPPEARRGLKESLAWIHAELSRPRPREAKGLILFARCSVDGCDRLSVATAATIENRFNVYPVPDILPLVELLQREPRFTLIDTTAEGADRILEIDNGLCTSHPQAALVLPSVVDFEPGPVVVAGDRLSFDRVASELSQRDLRGTCHHLQTRASSGDDIVAVAQQFVRELAQWRVDGVARRITRAALNNLPDAIAGVAASRAMLRAGLVKTLVVLPDLVRSDGWHCPSCDETADTSNAQAVCSHCGDLMQAAYQPLTELVRMASRRGIDVLVSETDELRKLGGVACLLAEPAERHLMPAPALVQFEKQAA